MLKRTIPDNSLQKLKQILSMRFGKDLQIQTLSSLSALPDENFSMKKDGSLHIPLQTGGAFLGTAVIPRASDLDDEKQEQISQIVRMVLEPSLYRSFLERREENLRTVQNMQFEGSNLRILENEEPTPEDLERPRLISNVVHLEGQQNEKIRRIALLLHEMTGRWAFVSLDDISSTLNSLDDLLKLGSITIFIDRLEALEPRIQGLLQEFLDASRSSQDPLIVTASSLSPRTLESLPNLSPSLLDELLINTLETDRIPVQERSLREILDLMFINSPHQD